MHDIRDSIFSEVKGEKYLARISAQGEGILSGIQWLRRACKTLGIHLKKCQKSGAKVQQLDTIAILEGDAKQIALGEEELIGWISKGSGIATVACKAKTGAGKKIKVVSGAWKKMPPPIKELVRQAVVDGGIHYHISEKPFIYLDKNYVKILGGVRKALLSVNGWRDFNKIVQLKSEGQRFLKEAILAAQMGAHIIMIDTGRKEDIERVDDILRKQRLRDRVKIAFGGNIQIEDLKELKKMPVEIVDIGKAIVDAPLLDMRMDVLGKV